MGMFDSVNVHCKNKDCDGVIEFQSKAGLCNLITYDIDEVPIPIAESIDGQYGVCPKCQCEVQIKSPYIVPKFVRMVVL